MIQKIILAVKTIKNLPWLFLDYFKLLHGDVTYYLWNGQTFVARAGTTDYSEIIINSGDFEYPSRFYPRNSSPIILDIGANIGESAICFYKKLELSDPTIYALEPNPESFLYLQKNIKLNHTASVKPYQLAITGKTGQSQLHFSRNNFDGGFVDNIRTKRRTKVVNVKTQTLEDFCRDHKISHVDLMKMDIEGSEYGVFATSLKFIQKHVASLFVEMHNLNRRQNYQTLRKFLVTHGFTVEGQTLNRTVFFLRNKSWKSSAV